MKEIFTFLHYYIYKTRNTGVLFVVFLGIGRSGILINKKTDEFCNSPVEI